MAAAPEASPQPAASQESARESAPATAADSGRTASFGGDCILPAEKRGRGAAVTSRHAPALAPCMPDHRAVGAWVMSLVAAVTGGARLWWSMLYRRAEGRSRWSHATAALLQRTTCVLHPSLGVGASGLGLEFLVCLYGVVSSGRGRDFQLVQSILHCLT